MVHSLKGLWQIIQLLPDLISSVMVQVGFLPSFLAIFATFTIIISVIYVILNK